MSWLDQVWYGHRHPLAWLLLPLTVLFALVSGLRRWAYANGWLSVHRLPVPVIVVGNITTGGTGKTPLVLWLTRHLRSLGYKPGIILRGYGGKANHWPQMVGSGSDPRWVGDEAALLAERSGCPVCAGPSRYQAGLMLLEHTDCNLIIADDGLQHYALERDLEIAVVDGSRGLGNGWLLPAGPLREPPGRLDKVDLVISSGDWEVGVPTMKPVEPMLESLAEPSHRQPLSSFAGRSVHAVAGLGNPWRFFDLLVRFGLVVRAYPFPDHHHFSAKDFQFTEPWPILMTTKDGVKCRKLGLNDAWQVQVEIQPDPAFIQQLDTLLKRFDGQQTA